MYPCQYGMQLSLGHLIPNLCFCVQIYVRMELKEPVYDMDICTLANLPYLEDGELISDPKVNYFIPNNGPCHLSGIPLQKGKNPTAWLESE
jgi:hypothetical protein